MQQRLHTAIGIGTNLKIHTQHADDIWAAIRFCQVSFNHLMKVFSDFSNFSGMRVNYEKTKILRIGSISISDDRLESPWPIKWEWQIKVLGIDFTTDYYKTRKVNFDKLIQKVKALIAIWSLRSFTVLGKILIVNALLVSQFMHKLLCIFSPEEIHLKQFRTLITDFIWDGKTTKIAYNRLIQLYQKGGLKRVDLRLKDLSLKASWVDRIAFSNNDIRLQNLKALLPISSRLIWRCNIDPKQVKQIMLVGIARNIWVAWATFNSKEIDPERNVQIILDQMLWFNTNIVKGKKPYVNRELLQVGINKISDIFDSGDKRFLTTQEIKNKYNFHGNFLGYHRLIDRIPMEWKRHIVNLSFGGITRISDVMNVSSFIYKDLLDQKLVENETTV